MSTCNGHVILVSGGTRGRLDLFLFDCRLLHVNVCGVVREMEESQAAEGWQRVGSQMYVRQEGHQGVNECH